MNIKLKMLLLLTLFVMPLTGCFKIAEAILTGQPKKNTEVVPVVQATIVTQSRNNVPIYSEYHWWYIGYHNLRQPLVWTPLTRKWYNTGRQHWWDNNIEPEFWPKTERRTMIPRASKSGIDRYVDNGVPTGSFLRAVLSNDLFNAVERADDYNKIALVAICEYIFHYTPTTCHGSPERVAAWLEFHQAKPHEANDAAGGDRERRKHYYEIIGAQ